MERMVTQADIDAYQASLIDMTDQQLLDELEMCARSNTFGSHDAQRTLVRHEIRLRMSA